MVFDQIATGFGGAKVVGGTNTVDAHGVRRSRHKISSWYIYIRDLFSVAFVCVVACVFALMTTIIQWAGEPVGVTIGEPLAEPRSDFDQITVEI